MSESRAILDEVWRDRQAQWLPAGGLPLHFGDADAEARAARSGVVLFDRSNRDFLRIRGARVRSMLQGQLTNDVARIVPGGGCYAAHLDAKGRMLGDMVLQFEAEDSVLIELEPEMAALLAKKFAPFAMLEDLEIAPLPDECRLLIAGPEAERSLVAAIGVEGLHDLPAYSFVAATWNERDLALSARAETGERSFLIAGSPEILADLARKLLGGGTRPAGTEAFDILRIEAGTPIWGRDMDGRNLPPECAIPHAVSYTKGCYVGQETVARMKTYGQANKELRGLRSTSLMPVNTALETRDGKVVGRVTSSSWSPQLEAPVALGYVQRDHLAAGTMLIGRADDGIFEVEVVDLPFVTRRFSPALPR